MEAFFHLTPNISYPLMLIVSALMLPVMIVRFYMGWFQMVMIDLPLIMASFWSISAFYVVAQRELYPKKWKRAMVFLPALMAAGVGLTHHQCQGRPGGAVRDIRRRLRARPSTPSARRAADEVAGNQYRRRSGWLPYAELAVGAYFVAMVVFAIETYNFFAIPFLLLFVGRLLLGWCLHACGRNGRANLPSSALGAWPHSGRFNDTRVPSVAALPLRMLK